jgi:tetratricopeptide (TPR) repeat protein
MPKSIVPAALFVLLCLVAPVRAGSVALETDDKFGTVSFPTTCAAEVQPQFERAVALLHSFEFEEGRGNFEEVARRDPECAMASWGVAMTYYHPLWARPTTSDLEKGSAAVKRAKGLRASPREQDYIEAIAVFYRDYEKLDHRTRAMAYEKAMEKVHKQSPEDPEAEAFYALAVLSNADPTDKTYATQEKSGAILEPLFRTQPDHPGLAHYIIHSYDYPPLADRAVHAAHRYLEIAPAAPHATHMSSHIFTQLGMWEDSIHANTLSANAARQRGPKTGAMAQARLAELHALDYMVYAYLQRGQDEKAADLVRHVNSMQNLNWRNGVVAYAASAIPVRHALERHRWEEAATLPELRDAEEAIGNYETQTSIALRYWARAVGAARSGQIEAAERELAEVERIAQQLQDDPDLWARHTSQVLRLQAAAWVAFAKEEEEQALELMQSAAALEDKTDKSSLSPGRVLPAREQLGDLLLELGRPREALRQYQASLEQATARFNSLYGAARAAQAAGEPEAARGFYEKLLELVVSGSRRPELEDAARFLQARAGG